MVKTVWLDVGLEEMVLKDQSSEPKLEPEKASMTLFPATPIVQSRSGSCLVLHPARSTPP